MKLPPVKTGKLLGALKAKLRQINADPEKVSLGYAFGVFLASTPFIGIKVFIAVIFTTLFKWSKISAVIGVFHINLFTAPFFYGVAFFVGKKILGSQVEFAFPDKFNLASMLEIVQGNISIFYSLSIGGLILGIPMAIGAYYFARSLTMSHRIKPVNP